MTTGTQDWDGAEFTCGRCSRKIKETSDDRLWAAIDAHRSECTGQYETNPLLRRPDSVAYSREWTGVPAAPNPFARPHPWSAPGQDPEAVGE